MVLPMLRIQVPDRYAAVIVFVEVERQFHYLQRVLTEKLLVGQQFSRHLKMLFNLFVWSSAL